MFFSTRSNLQFPDPKSKTERIVVGPNQRVPDECLKDPKVVKDLLAKGLITEFNPTPSEPPKASETSKAGYWDFDPESLAKDSLDMLNMKIQGHVKKVGLAPVAAFSDKEDALLFMTQDRKA